MKMPIRRLKNFKGTEWKQSSPKWDLPWNFTGENEEKTGQI
jgi:hypothetical protein